jgi:hypothetical protein
MPGFVPVMSINRPQAAVHIPTQNRQMLDLAGPVAESGDHAGVTGRALS